MFCPNCGSTQSDELRFCKACGANLEAVRKAVTEPEKLEKFDWNKTWVAEMLMSGEESVRRAKEIERLQGITPETKRRNEIKAGVITGSIGIGVMILLYVIMQGIILSGNVDAGVAQILSRVWIAGVIPMFVGLALIVNGVFVSRRGQEAVISLPESEKENSAAEFLPPIDTNRLAPGTPFSVTDETTRHLEEPVRRKTTSGS